MFTPPPGVVVCPWLDCILVLSVLFCVICACQVETARRGRFGFAISIFGFLILVEGVKMFIPATMNPRFEDDITREDGAFDEVCD